MVTNPDDSAEKIFASRLPVAPNASRHAPSLRRIAVIGVILLLGASSVTASLAQALYKSVTPDGRTVYSDTPPSDGRIEKILEFQNPPASALPAAESAYVERLHGTKAVAPTTAAGRGVVLYSAAWCGYCKLAKAYLASNGIEYQDVDIETRDGLIAFAQAGGHKGIPLLLAGDRRVQGFSTAAYDAFFSHPR